jgi:hypothetical protein
VRFDQNEFDKARGHDRPQSPGNMIGLPEREWTASCAQSKRRVIHFGMLTLDHTSYQSPPPPKSPPPKSPPPKSPPVP